MPRPRVRPENRIRCSRACDSCKASKIRCNSRLPCAACIKRNRPGDCSFATPTNRPVRLYHHGSDASHVSTSPNSSTPTQYSLPQATMAIAPPVTLAPPSRPDTATGDDSTSRGTSRGQDSPRERFVTGSNGEKGMAHSRLGRVC